MQTAGSKRKAGTRACGLTGLAAAALAAGVFSPLMSQAAAHGGVYRGPGALIGPGGATAGGPSSGGAGFRDTDVAAWDQWWSFNRDGYLSLREAVFGRRAPATGPDLFFGDSGAAAPLLRPTEATLRGVVVPALLALLDRQKDVDILTGVLLALAKIGDPPGGPNTTAGVLRPYLGHSNQEVHETAALALGVLAEPSAAPLLADLLLDTSVGQTACGRRRVPQRTRAFAAYGLGLVGHRADTDAVKRFVVHHLAQAIDAGTKPTRDVFVASVIGMGLVRLPSAPPADPASADRGDEVPAPRVSASREGQLELLLRVLADTSIDARARAHVPVALVRLARGVAPEYKRRLVAYFAEALEPRSKEAIVVQHGILLASGRLADNDEDDEDRTLRAALLSAVGESDRLGRRLALLALARAAGRSGGGEPGEAVADVRQELLTRLARGSTSERPWAALGLGLLEHAQVADGAAPSDSTRRALADAFEKAGNPSDQGAQAIALGLVRHLPSVPTLIERTTTGDENVRGYTAVALGMMGAVEATGPLRAIVGLTTYRPGVVREAAIGLALLGDQAAVPILVDRLTFSTRMYEQLAMASALGFVGDGRTIDPLVSGLSEKRRLSETSRAFLAVALGMICDKEGYPWNAKIAADVLWWQAPETLHDPVAGKGVLDIL